MRTLAIGEAQSYRLTFGNVCCRADVNMAGFVTESSAPVLRKFVGQEWDALRRWVLARGGIVEELEEVKA